MLRTIMKYFLKWCKGEIPKVDAWYFIQGHVRETLYYSRFKFFIRRYVKEQIEWRMIVVDKECWNTGQCKLCGCSQPALLMSDKTCHKPCYFPMLNRKEWRVFKEYGLYIKGGKIYNYDKSLQILKIENYVG